MSAEKVEALAGLAHFAAQLKAAQERTHAHAILARMAGASWSEIGALTGISKQAAQQKYGKDAAAEPKMTKPDAAGPSVTPSIFLDPMQNPMGQLVDYASKKVDPITATADDQEAESRAGFWEAKRRYAVTECGAIYAPQGEHGWKLEKVVRNVRGKFHKKRYEGMAEFLHDFDGVLWIDRDRYEGLVQNAAASRETWVVVAAEPKAKTHSVSAHRELSKEIDEIAAKFAEINKTLKAKRTKKAAPTA